MSKVTSLYDIGYSHGNEVRKISKCDFITCIYNDSKGICKSGEIELKSFDDYNILKINKENLNEVENIVKNYVNNICGRFRTQFCVKFKMDWRKISPNLYKVNGNVFDFCPNDACKLVNKKCPVCGYEEIVF